jgi:hypothetical protein
MAEESGRAKPSSKIESRKAALREHLQSLETLRLCSPSDDPEEQTGVIESYRYILINIKMLSKGIVSSDTSAQLDGLNPDKIGSVYDVYTSKAYLDAIAYEVAFDLENISDAPEPSATHHLISPQLIKALKESKPNAFDASRLAEYCREINSGFAHGNLISCLLLMRAVLNHVPPVFGQTDFSQVVAHASRSLKENFEHLDDSLRKIGDLYTHQHMRPKDHLPTPGQVRNFGPQFELLLQEVLTRI